MSLREWLIAIGTLVILGIVIDGIRRMHRARKESLAISSGMGADDLKDSPLDDDFNPELPNGGARTVSRDTLEQRGYVKRDASDPFSSLDDDEEISLETGWGAHEPDPAPTSAEPERASTKPAPVKEKVAEQPLAAGDDEDGILGKPRVVRPERPAPIEPKTPEKQPAVSPPGASRPKQPVAASAKPARAAQEPPVVTTQVEENTAQRVSVARDKKQPLAGANRPEAREVVVINVLSRQGETFKGADLKRLFEACGLELGDMDIYHRHEEADTTTPVQFSVANAVEPGTFKPGDMATLSTPGISFFMSLPGPTNAMQAFDFMLETAQCVVRNMGGELKDERRSVMTPQTIEHCRQRIREFERKRRSQRV
ncbi:MAG: cell division protein ZipA [Pseudomonadota bacterium]|nr:cell division protein ZipA [Pseudomonadota bacterium]